MVLILVLTMILAITLSSLLLINIYKNRSASLNLLFAVVLVALLVLTGTGVGGYGGFFQVTTGLNGLCEGLHVFSYIINDVTTIAEYVYNSIVSNFSVSCDGADDLPRLMEFRDLHLTESLKEAKTLLKEQPGVY